MIETSLKENFSESDFQNFEKLPLKNIYSLLQTSEAGLSSSDATKRRAQYGFNVLTEQKQHSNILKLLRYVSDIFSLILFFASILAFLARQWNIGIAIIIVIFINVGFNFYQESRAMSAMNALKSWIPNYAKVIRDGVLQKITVSNLVPGDIIALEEGDRVPADARIFEAFDFYVLEIPLTGEFEPQLKLDEKNLLSKNESQLKEETLTTQNVVFMSTSVVRGQGKAVIISTGMSTRYGRIANLTQSIRQDLSPLEKEIKYFARYSFILALVFGGSFFVLSYFILHLSLLGSSIFVIGVMIACVPEGLQATISSALWINVSKMIKQNVLVKRLSAVQSLGSITLIFTDKTGTLTKGEMTVNKIWLSDKTIDISGVGYIPKGEFIEYGRKHKGRESKELNEMLKIGALCNAAKLQPPNEQNKSWTILGDPTDGALLVAAIKYGLNIPEMLKREPIVHIFPFDSERKLMSTIHKVNGSARVYIKGAPTVILKKSSKILWNNKQKKLKKYVNSISQNINDLSKKGLRVIALAMKELPKFLKKQDQLEDRDNIESNLIFVGLAAIKDPPRPEVKDAMVMARKAGIKVSMITGDYGITAEKIAREVGIIDPNEKSIVLSGEEINKMTDSELGNLIKQKNIIFARVTPEHKLRMVKIARQTGEIVAVTGDGANDAPALRQSDIGIAMGVAGTDIAKESADIVLTDDSFASIVHSIENGRSIWNNLRKFIYYTYTHNWAELIPFILFILFNTPLPLLAAQVLIIDLCIDIIPSLAISRDSPQKDIMNLPPRDIKEHLFNRPIFIRSLIIGFVIGILGFVFCLRIWILGGWSPGIILGSEDPIYLKGTTMTFAIIVMGQIGNLLSSHFIGTKSVRLRKISDNHLIYYSFLCQLGLLILIIYLPGMESIFGTQPLNVFDWLLLILIPFLVIDIQIAWQKVTLLKEKKLKR